MAETKKGQVKGVSARRDQQILEKGKMIFRICGIITLTMLVLALLGADPKGKWIQVGICVAAMVALTVISKKLKGTFWAMYDCLYVMLVLYIVGLWVTNNTYVYALMYPIAVLVIFIMDKTLGVRGVTGAIVVNIIYVVIHFIRCGLGDWQQVISQLIVAVATCIICVITINNLDKHNRENLDDLQFTVDRSTNTSEKILDASEDISNQIDGAQDLVSSLTNSIDRSNDSIGEIAESIRQTAEAIEKQTVMTSDIQNNLQGVNEKAGRMKEASSRTLDNVSQSKGLIEQLDLQAQETGRINEVSKNNTASLNESIKKVANIVTTITSISEDTTLLSLNASIEAARAGEAGKGFAVVADEIRKLSEQTKNSAETIAEIIQQLVGEVEQAASNMELSVENSERQTQMITELGENFEVVFGDVKTLAEDVKGITADVSGIVEANTSIMDSISNLSATSEEITAVSESAMELARTSKDNMQDVNDVLKGIFTVSGEMKNAAEEANELLEKNLDHGRDEIDKYLEMDINHFNNPS